MKKKFLAGIAALTVLVACDPSTLQNALSSAQSGISTQDLISGVGALVENLTSSDNITEADLVGSWQYYSPAVSFRSEDFLKKAGGAAAATIIEKKLEPVYKSVGMDKTVLTVNEDKSFNMQFGKMSLNGTLQKDNANKCFVFNFKVLGATLVSSSAFVSKTAMNSIVVTFDVSKLEKILSAAAAISGNSTVKSLTSLLSSYDGIRAGFRMK